MLKYCNTFKTNLLKQIFYICCLVILSSIQALPQKLTRDKANEYRQRITIDNGWRFFKYKSEADADSLIYDVRPEVKDYKNDKLADGEQTRSVEVKVKQEVLKPWIMPTGNGFIRDPAKRYIRPKGNPGSNFPFVKNNFNDSSWEKVNLPHDWAIKGPFYKGPDAKVGGEMGRLPSPGVAWYRKKLNIPALDKGKSIFLEVEGAMSYAIVWLNGKLVGGWPYGYASWCLNLTPYIIPGGVNQLAIRLDNPNNSSRWYPGGGIYRNVWLIITNPVHVAQWGTYVTTKDVSKSSAKINLKITLANDSKNNAKVKVVTEIFALNKNGDKTGKAVAIFKPLKKEVDAGNKAEVESSIILKNPRLWGPPPTQVPNLYEAVTSLWLHNKRADQYKTSFGIRSIYFDPDSGLYVNGEHIRIQGVNLHSGLGPLGAAFNTSAAERQLQTLHDMGCNAIRTAHNPPAPEFLELTDRMGFLVMDEIFDCWYRGKNPLDFHLIFKDWHEQDLRAFIRRDRNHPSVFLWSFGNEVGEQYTGKKGAAVAKRLYDIVKEEDPTRPATASMNFAKPNMPFPAVMDVISLNYQGEGIRNAPAYSGLKGITTPPLYTAFHRKFPGKAILSSENADAFSSRGTYLFPVYGGISAPVKDDEGGDPKDRYVSAYGLYTAPFGSSPDKVFATLDKHPFVAGGFVWSGWDYLGEPTPYYLSRSSYCGIIDLAGFKKDRFYLYQSRWRPNLPMAHIVPQCWNWPERIDKVTPVHVYTSGDEAELFLNGKSLGLKKKGKYEYRLRWDSVRYEPGVLKVVAYKNGKKWAEDIVRTTGEPARLEASSNHSKIRADGKDLAFITVQVADKNGLTVPNANNSIKFNIKGPGEIVSTANGDPTNLVPFPSHKRKAFNGLALVIIRAKPGTKGLIKVTAQSPGLKEAQIIVKSY